MDKDRKVSPSTRQDELGEEQGDSALRRHAAQQQRAQQTPGSAQQDASAGEDPPPFAPRNPQQQSGMVSERVRQSGGGEGASVQERQEDVGKTEFEDFLRIEENTPYPPRQAQQSDRRRRVDDEDGSSQAT